MNESANSFSRLRAAAVCMSNDGSESSPQTKRGWQRDLLAVRVKPDVVSYATFKSMSESERFAYNARRIGFHMNLNSIHTPQMTAAHELLTNSFESLSGRSSVARPGVMLTGLPFAGKSTIITTWGAQVESALRDAAGIPLVEPGSRPGRLSNNSEFLPVAYFSLSEQLKASLRNGVRFYDESLPSRSSDADYLLSVLTNRINNCGTRVVLLDQFQEIGNAQAGALRISGSIKHLMDQCPNTLFVGAGIGIENLDILSDGRDIEALGQTGNRFALHPIAPFDISDPGSASQFISLLRTFEKQVMLFKHEDGDIVNQANYIYERTNGLTGSIMKLLRDACRNAITSGKERISNSVLEKVKLSAYLDVNSGHLDLPAPPPTRRRAA